MAQHYVGDAELDDGILRNCNPLHRGYRELSVPDSYGMSILARRVIAWHIDVAWSAKLSHTSSVAG